MNIFDSLTPMCSRVNRAASNSAGARMWHATDMPECLPPRLTTAAVGVIVTGNVDCSGSCALPAYAAAFERIGEDGCCIRTASSRDEQSPRRFGGGFFYLSCAVSGWRSVVRTIEIFDTTLRDGEQSPGAAMTPAARLRIAQMLCAANVDTIEAGFPAASATVQRSVAQVARRVRGSRIAALARCTQRDIDLAAEALKDAYAPRIHTFIATSAIHLEHKLRISQDAAVEMASAAICYARKRCDDVEFSAEDATRTDPRFLARIFSAAIAAGARTLNVPDTVGYSTPAEMHQLITYLRSNVEGIENARLSVHTHDDLGMATANALAAVSAGASQVECTVNGIGERAGNCALEEVVVSLRTREDVFECATRVDTRMLRTLSGSVSRATRMAVQKNKAIVGGNAFAHESGIHQDGMLKERRTYEIIDPRVLGVQSSLPLGRNSGRHAVLHRAAQLGLAFSDRQRRRFEDIVADFSERQRAVRDEDLIRLAQLAVAGGEQQ